MFFSQRIIASAILAAHRRVKGGSGVSAITGLLQDSDDAKMSVSPGATPRIIETWRSDYNTMRPHTSLNGLRPSTLPLARAGA